MADLVWHVIGVQAFWSQIVQHRLQDPAAVVRSPRPPDERLLALLQDGSRRLAEVLVDADPAVPVWTWSSQNDAAFVLRHQVQEAAVHRWDAEHAVGLDNPIGAAAASDAVDEFLQFSLGSVAAGRSPCPAPLLIAATDTGQEWTVVPVGDRVEPARLGERVDPGATTQIRGPASDVLLWLYGRRPLAALTVVGDPAAAHALSAHTRTT